MINFKDIREEMSDEEVINALSKYDITPVRETEMYMVYPTCCHNLEHGSHKLYYYKNTHMFRCFTECDEMFDIFDLLVKINGLRGNEITVFDAAQELGYDTTQEQKIIDPLIEQDKKSLSDIVRIKNTVVPIARTQAALNQSILEKYLYNEQYLKPWLDEGITTEMLRYFNIKYDLNTTSIVIPHKDKNGNIIGIRGRFMSEDAANKYMPLMYAGEFLSHRLGENLYGLHENKSVINKNHVVVIFESEKSVLKFGSFFGKDNNFSVATCGNKISNEQIQLLVEIGVSQVILAYDKDYEDVNHMAKVQEHYEAIGKRLANYFTTSIIMDYGNLLGFKDSPIDRGKEVFEELYRYRYFI